MLRIIIGCLALCISGVVIARNSPNIDKILSDADFHPSIPSRAAIESVYGKGKALPKNGIEYVFYSIGNNRQMWLSYSEGSSANTTFVTEVTICRCKLVDEVPLAISAVTTDSLLSIRIDDSSRVLERSQNRYVKSIETVGKKRLQVYERNPVPGETDLYIRYLICAGRVIGFSVGVTE
jgi:hypothetical protein